MRVWSILLAGAALLGAGGAAWSYVPDDSFAARAGSAAAITARDTLLDPVALAIRDKVDQPGKPKNQAGRDLAAIAVFYEGRDFQPAWIAEGRVSDKAKALIARLGEADADGLDAKSYPTPAADARVSDPAAIAEAEIRLSQSAVAYARDAEIGRVVPGSIAPDIGFEPVATEPPAVLAKLLAATDPAAQLEAFNPPHEGYRRLRTLLAELRKNAGEAKEIQIPPGKTAMKLGMTDPRVPALRQRLDLAQNPAAPELYDEEVVAAVKAFQKSRGLTVDGVLGASMVAMLNATAVDKIGELIANMERWRWMPRDLGRFHVQVNVPEFMLYVRRDGRVSHSTRVVVGKVTNKTPIFSDEIEHIIVNPSWNVPLSIAAKEMIPDILKNPAYFQRTNYQVLANVGGKFQPVDPKSIDWATVNPKQIRFRQPPGEANALGNIKFMFPNKYAVYLHDTPSKSLFKNDYRAYSHGCMRVMDPMAFADALLAEDKQWNAAKIKKLIGGAEQQLNIAEHVPVHVTYFTAWVDDAGVLQTRADLYGYSAAVRKALRT